MTGHLQSADTTLASAVSETLSNLELIAADAAGKRLAMRYAQRIDAAVGTPNEADMLERLGPKLLACLVELGATPKARSAVFRSPAPPTGSQLHKMRAARSG